MALDRTCFFNGFELYVDRLVFSMASNYMLIDLPKRSYFGAKKSCFSSMYTWAAIGSFEDQIFTNGYAPQLR